MVAAIDALFRHHDGVDPLLVGIDGCSGAGRTALADGLVAARGGVVVRIDDFYREMEVDRRAALDPQEGYELYFDWQRLIGGVLDPLVLGQPGLYHPHDWSADALSDDVVVVEPQGLIVVEGVYALRPQLRGYWDIGVFVDTPAEVRADRLEGRPGHDASWAPRWAAAEQWYLEHVDPRPQADLVLPGV